MPLSRTPTVTLASPVVTSHAAGAPTMRMFHWPVELGIPRLAQRAHHPIRLGPEHVGMSLARTAQAAVTPASACAVRAEQPAASRGGSPSLVQSGAEAEAAQNVLGSATVPKTDEHLGAGAARSAGAIGCTAIGAPSVRPSEAVGLGFAGRTQRQVRARETHDPPGMPGGGAEHVTS